MSVIGFALGLALAYVVVTRTGSTWLAGAAFLAVHIIGYFAWHHLFAGELMRRHEAALQVWKRSYLCMACGHLFVGTSKHT